MDLFNVFRRLIWPSVGPLLHSYSKAATTAARSRSNPNAKDGKLVKSAYQDISQAGAAGALYSTVEDLFRWNEGLFGGKVLQPRSLKAMTTTWAKDYGYGLVIQTDFHRKHFSHGGRISGFYNDIEYFPDDRVTVVVLRNLYDSDPPPRNVAFDLAAIVLGEKYEVPLSHVEVKVDRKILDTYVGRYELEPNVFLTITVSIRRVVLTCS
jgi:CubicO group peptidase (beta-lactamase class C family)